jgi:hypothetical protein
MDLVDEQQERQRVDATQLRVRDTRHIRDATSPR